MSAALIKPLVWIGSSRDDLKEFPEEVRALMGHALYMAQCGLKHEAAKPLKGFGGAGVLKIPEDFSGDTYRAVYTVRLPGRLYALHAFLKTSKRGIATPKQDPELVRSRLKWAAQLHEKWQASREGGRR